MKHSHKDKDKDQDQQMNRTDSTPISEFESAISQLSDRVEDVSRRIQKVMSRAGKQKDELVDIAHEIKEAVSPLMPFLDRAKDVGDRLLKSVQQRPRPYLMTAVGLGAGYVLFSYLTKDEDFTEEPVFSASTRSSSIQAPDLDVSISS